MTNKQRILQMVERWPEDIPYDEALYHVYVLKKIDDGLKSLESGPSKDHDELFDELERLCDEEESQAEESPLAQDDLKRLRKWILTAGAPRTATSFVSRLRKYVARLRDFPESGAVVEDYYDPAFREIIFQDQRVIYRFDGATVLILTVFHGSHVPKGSHLFGE